MKSPKVSVIMPVYNAENFINITMDSILNQSFTDFEFLIIDDGSTDKSIEIISSYKDQRIKVYKNENNIGYVNTLNKLLNLAKGEYIARQDNDDISLVNRIERQVNFLDKNLDIGIVGSYATIFGNKTGKLVVPINDQDIKALMIIDNPFVHSSIMMRRNIFNEIFKTKYDVYYSPAEDYAMWFEISKRTKLANLNDTLLLYRWHEKSVSQLKQNIQIDKAIDIQCKIIKDTLSIEMTDKEKYLHALITKSNDLNINDLKLLEIWLIKILQANKINKYYSDHAFRKVILYAWTKVCIRKNKIPIHMSIYLYFSSKIFNIISFINLISIQNLKKYLLFR